MFSLSSFIDLKKMSTCAMAIRVGARVPCCIKHQAWTRLQLS